MMIRKNQFGISTFIKNNRGSSLLVAIVFSAFLTLVILAVGKIVDENRSSRLRVKILDSRSLVLKLALRNARVATYYYKTITTPAPTLDPVFQACMIGDGVTPLCSAGGPHPLALIDDLGAPIMGGSPATPVFYDIYGNVCPVLNPTDCFFEVWATYNVTCPLSGSPCLQASTIDVTVFLKVSDSALPSNAISMPVLSATQVVSISNFFDFFDPAFPPVSIVSGTPGDAVEGAPISGNAGPGGPFRNYIEPFSSSGLCIESYSCSGSCSCTYTGSGAGSGVVSGPSPIPAVSSCPAGEQSVGGQCTSFHF